MIKKSFLAASLLFSSAYASSAILTDMAFFDFQCRRAIRQSSSEQASDLLNLYNLNEEKATLTNMQHLVVLLAKGYPKSAFTKDIADAFIKKLSENKRWYTPIDGIAHALASLFSTDSSQYQTFTDCTLTSLSQIYFGEAFPIAQQLLGSQNPRLKEFVDQYLAKCSETDSALAYCKYETINPILSFYSKESPQFQNYIDRAVQKLATSFDSHTPLDDLPYLEKILGSTDPRVNVIKECIDLLTDIENIPSDPKSANKFKDSTDLRVTILAHGPKAVRQHYETLAIEAFLGSRHNHFPHLLEQLSIYARYNSQAGYPDYQEFAVKRRALERACLPFILLEEKPEAIHEHLKQIHTPELIEYIYLAKLPEEHHTLPIAYSEKTTAETNAYQMRMREGLTVEVYRYPSSSTGPKRLNYTFPEERLSKIIGLLSASPEHASVNERIISTLLSDILKSQNVHALSTKIYTPLTTLLGESVPCMQEIHTHLTSLLSCS